ncbi:hypothetical protein GGX14DRAFT_632484 [Mycena pura]|uniref:Uncharacterized protein n=1 Tax=Mycena pura TaxID=153505 RepID=A0AAD6VCQ7_9AGAR|nr:hypothetical protein GGX14DRAFT_632484 [Mycena pura]
MGPHGPSFGDKFTGTGTVPTLAYAFLPLRLQASGALHRLPRLAKWCTLQKLTTLPPIPAPPPSAPIHPRLLGSPACSWHAPWSVPRARINGASSGCLLKNLKRSCWNAPKRTTASAIGCQWRLAARDLPLFVQSPDLRSNFGLILTLIFSPKIMMDSDTAFSDDAQAVIKRYGEGLIRKHDGIRFDHGAITENQAICSQLLDFSTLFDPNATTNEQRREGMSVHWHAIHAVLCWMDGICFDLGATTEN